MFIYFANMFGLILLHYFFYKKKTSTLETYCWISTIFFFSIFIGFRYEVGGDWIHYKNFFYEYSKSIDSSSIVEFWDHGLVYVVINLISYFLGIDFIGANFVCAIIFMIALSGLLYDTKNRWLGLLVSYPIIIVVLGMGYTRQGLAFAFSLLLLKSLENKKLYRSFIYLTLAILSHQSSLLLTTFILFYFLYNKRYSDLIKLILVPICFGTIFFDKFSHLLYFYIGTGQHMTAIGSIPRSFLIFIVAVLFILFRKKFVNMTQFQIYTYNWIAYMVILIMPLSIISTITADRLLLYLYTLKIAFVSHANLEDKVINAVVFFIVSIYLLYLIIWLNFGKNSLSWVPYNFI